MGIPPTPEDFLIDVRCIAASLAATRCVVPAKLMAWTAQWHAIIAMACVPTELQMTVNKIFLSLCCCREQNLMAYLIFHL